MVVVVVRGPHINTPTMDIPVPDPPTLPSPLPAIFKADIDMYGATAKITRAPDAGYAATDADQKAEMVDERKRQAAKVFFFRFNSLPDSAKLACEGTQAIPGSKDMELRWKKYKGMEQKWQNACIGMPNNTTKSIDAYWFLAWVDAHVSHHDWIVVTSNIRLQYHRWKLNLPPPVLRKRAFRQAQSQHPEPRPEANHARFGTNDIPAGRTGDPFQDTRLSPQH